jgi:putative transposase
MARRLRIQFPGATYHIINRGNYRRDLFGTVGAARAFENILGETTIRFGWELHAFGIMRNHFHLAVTTPAPNLGDGMHWLQTTFAVRFNRFRSENGHLFQGRYQSPLVQDAAALVRVVDYIHLNPVNAKIVLPENAADFRWSSLARLVKGPRPKWLTPTTWLQELGLNDTRRDWKNYLEHLNMLAARPDEQQQQDWDELTGGFAIGTMSWKQAIARKYSFRSLELDLPGTESAELKAARWNVALHQALQLQGKSVRDIAPSRKGADWKVSIALALRTKAGAPYRWICDSLAMGSPNSVRVAVCRLANM